MDLRDQPEKVGMPIPLGYNPPIRESTSKATSSIPTGRNGKAVFNPTQTLTLDQQPQIRVPNSNPGPDPIPTDGSNPIVPTVRYRECLKNHAASIGGHVVDGCGEFMPAGEEGSPDALKCAACDCHRNFHRKGVDGEPPTNCFYPYNKNHNPPHLLPPPPKQYHKFNSLGLPESPGVIPRPPFPSMVMAFGGGGATDSSSEDLNATLSTNPPPLVLSKKRFRTKFTQEQKEKMMEFAEKVGWKIKKEDEAVVQQLCTELGIKRQVLKVWMHNNKLAMKKQHIH